MEGLVVGWGDVGWGEEVFEEVGLVVFGEFPALGVGVMGGEVA